MRVSRGMRRRGVLDGSLIEPYTEGKTACPAITAVTIGSPQVLVSVPVRVVQWPFGVVSEGQIEMPSQ